MSHATMRGVPGLAIRSVALTVVTAVVLASIPIPELRALPLVGAVGTAVAVEGITTRVSVGPSSVEANGESNRPAISSDGRFVAFESLATNLVAGDTNGIKDVFVRDRAVGLTERVSVSSLGVQALGGQSRSAALSGDGRYVVFSSLANNLVVGDANGSFDIFVHDRTSSVTTRVSVSSAGGEANGGNVSPSISRDGRYVVFQTLATNLDGAGATGIFIHDRDTAETTRVTVAHDGQAGNGNSQWPSVSDDGRYVAFLSSATNLIPNDTNGLDDVFVRDRTAGTVTRVSVSSSGEAANLTNHRANISADGRYVVFQSSANNLVQNDTNDNDDAFLHDTQTGTTTRISINAAGEEGNHDTVEPKFSANGAFVVFFSGASNFVDGDLNDRADVFVRDLASGAMALVSVATSGAQANGFNPEGAQVSEDGQFVAFESFATNLVDQDANGVADIFVRDRGAAGDFGSIHGHTFGNDPNGAYSRDPVNLATGVFTTSSADLVMAGRVLAFAFTRSYNSADDRGGPLGEGWTHSYLWSLADAGPTVEVRRGSGSRSLFTRNPDGTYADPPNVFDTLTKNVDGTFTLTLTSQLKYEFSSAGSLMRIHEPAGNQILLAYTGPNLTAITDTVGRQFALTYDGSNRLTQLQDPLGRRVTYSYDANERLSTATDRIGNAPGQNPALHRWTYAYDGATRHIRTITDPDGRVRVTNTYDSQGRVHEQRDALNKLTLIDYGAGQTIVTDPRLHATTYTFDNRMRVLTQADTVGANTYMTTYVYDTAGNRTSVTDRNGKTTDVTYDSRGNVLSKTDPEIDPPTPRYVTTFTYDAKNNLTLITDARDFDTTLAYDPTSNVLLSVSRVLDASTSAVTKYEYTDASNPGVPTKVIAPRGNTGQTPNYTFATLLTYDAQGNLTQRVDPDGAKTTFVHDGAGRVATFVDPDGYAFGANPLEHTWTVGYDENDRETSRTDPLGNVLRFGYDGAGNRTTVTDRRGNITTYRYDLNTRLETVQQLPDPLNQPLLTYITEIERDDNGNATRITQANGVATDYTFDALDRLTSVETHPDAQTTLTTTYVLDGNGQPTSRTSGDNVTVTYTYDALSRLSTVSGPSLSVTYEYDPLSQRTEMVDATGTTTYQHDGLGRLTQVAAPNGTLTYGYDRDGNRITVGYPDSQNVTYAYSPGGRLNTVTDWASRLSTYTYKPSGLVSSLSYPNTMFASYEYDNTQRLKVITNSVGATTITQHTYTLDAEGNRTALDEYVQGITQAVQTWSPSVQVNDATLTTSQQDRPDIALGADGAAYLIWDDFRNSGQTDIYFSRRNPATGVWSANQKVNNDTGLRAQYNAAIAVDTANNAYAVWQDQREGTNNNPDTNIYFSKRFAATGLWSANVRVNNDTSGRPSQITPEIAVRGTGDAVAVWEDHRSNQWNVYSSRLIAGGSTWAPNLRVTDNTGSRKFTPDVAVDADGTAYAVWEDDRSGNADIWFSRLPVGSSTWSANVKISDDPGSAAQYDPQIGIDSAGNVLVTWIDDRVASGQVRSRRLPAGSSTWSLSAVATNSQAVPVASALGVRPDGTAFVAWQDARGTSQDVWGAEYNFATNLWSSFELVSDDPASSHQMRPDVAANSTEIAIAWRDDRVSGGDIRARRRTTSNGVDHFAYSYDGLNRLVSVTGASTESYSFDSASNIANSGFVYDDANRLTSDAVNSYDWDNADRLARRGADTFTFDALARLTRVTLSTDMVEYTYDGDGRLSDRIYDGPPPELPPLPGHVGPFVWDQAATPSALAVAGPDKVVHGLAPLYGVNSSGAIYTFARDALGSVRAELGATGTVSSAFRYATYGAVVRSTGNRPSLLGYAGEVTDGTGLTYLRARWYDSANGRFVSRDQLHGAPEGPSGLNGYTYAAGNPVMRTDPSGNCSPPSGGVGFCIARFIPTDKSCAGPLCGSGDDRYAPMENGGTHRVIQWVDASGNVTADASPSLLYVGPFSDPRGPQPGALSGGCSGVTDPNNISLDCTAYNGYTDATRSPGGVYIPGAPAGPIQTRVQITFAPNGRPIVFAQGTYYPSLEIWYYGSGGAQLAYFYNAVGVGQEGLARVGNLARNWGGPMPK